MRYFCFVEPESGKIVLNITAINSDVADKYNKDGIIGPIEVNQIMEPENYYYSKGQFVKYPSEQPTPDHEFNLKTKKWEIKNEDVIISKNKAIRDDLLIKTDWTQIPDADISEESRKEFQEYRQKLRDIDKINPVWPVEPEIKKRGQ